MGTSPVADPAADLFNAAVAASAISAAWELGLLSAVNADKPLDVAEFTVGHDLHQPTVTAILDALASVRVVRWDDARTTVVPAERHDEAVRTRGFFHWLSGGCGELFSSLAAKARNAERVGDFVRRDGAAVAAASREIGRDFIDPTFAAVVAGTRHRTVADLGCGSAERLIQLVRADPEVRGIGVDISAAALAAARTAVTEAGVGDRITLVRDDVAALTPRPEYATVDLVTCLLMGHDLWPRPGVVSSLRGISAAFPAVRRFLLVDTCRSEGLADGVWPVFTLGFEVAHAAMGKYLPTLAEWHGVFAEAGWRRLHTHEISPPAFTAIFELEPADLDGAP
jgi:SAM-dependent methyltransferase